MKTRGISILITILFVLLAACAQTPLQITEEPPPSTSPTGAPTQIPHPTTASQFTLDVLNSFTPDHILLQEDYEPGFSLPELFFDFGRVPPFTMFADGRVIYIDEGATFDDQLVMETRLTPEETVAMMQQVLDFGFERLESYTDFSKCEDQADGTSNCVAIADASTTIL